MSKTSVKCVFAKAKISKERLLWSVNKIYISHKSCASILLCGVCNPVGENDTYNGLYLKDEEIASCIASGDAKGLPVLTEHTGEKIGSVVSVFKGLDHCMMCVLDIDDSSMQGDIIAGMIRDNVAQDLSLGYSVEISQSNNSDKLQAKQKKIKEISVVKRGARKGCHIMAYEDKKGLKIRKNVENDTWSCFDMS